MSTEHSGRTFRKSYYGEVITWEGIENYRMMSLKKPQSIQVFCSLNFTPYQRYRRIRKDFKGSE